MLDRRTNTGCGEIAYVREYSTCDYQTVNAAAGSFKYV